MTASESMTASLRSQSTRVPPLRLRVLATFLRRHAAASALLAVVVVSLLALAPSPAQASQQYPYLGQIEGVGFNSPLAADPHNGDLIVSETPQESGPNGENLRPNVVRILSPAGAQLGLWRGAQTPALSFGETTNSPVAANAASGDVYVADRAHHVIDVFEAGPAEHYLCQITGAGSASTSPSECDKSAPGVPGGNFGVGNLSSEIIWAIAVDPTSGDLYVGYGQESAVVYEFGPGGAYLGEVSAAATPPGSFRRVTSLAVDGASGRLLVGDQGAPSYVDVFEAATGSYLESWAGSKLPSGEISTFALAASSTSGEAFVTEQSATSTARDIAVLGPAGNYLATIAGVAGRLPFAEAATEGGGRQRAPQYLQSLALDPAAGRLYALFGSSTVQPPPLYVFGATPVHVPTTTSLPAAPVHAYGATLRGEVNPEGEALTDCRFEYVTKAQYEGTSAEYFSKAKTVPCQQSLASIGSGSSPVGVSAEIEGLKPESSYDYRLVAANANESPNPVSYGSYASATELETLPVPVIVSARAEEVGPTAARLAIVANPKGAATTCTVEYGTTAAYGQSAACAPEDIGSGFADVKATAGLQGLTEGATYHFRVVLSSVAATIQSIDHTFVYLIRSPLGGCPNNEALRSENGASPFLPDCRAYELVTPAHKNGAAIGRGLFIMPTFSSPDGSRVMAGSLQAFGEASASEGSRYLPEGDPFSFARTPSGWQATPFAPPATQVAESTRLEEGAEADTALFSGSGPGGEEQFYLREASGALVDVGPVFAPGAHAHQLKNLGGFSTDLSHFDWEENEGEFEATKAPRWPFDEGHGPSLYEYAGPAARPILVGVTGAEGSTSLVSACGTEKTGGESQLSADGRTAFFQARKCAHGTGENAPVKVPSRQLYARLDGELQDAHTLHLSERFPASCHSAACLSSAPADAAFQGASEDGRYAYFTSSQQLTDSATQGSSNLYLYDLGAEQLYDASASTPAGEAPGVAEGLLALSADGRYAYFVASGTLAANEGATADPGTGEVGHAEAGANNLYLYEAPSEAQPEGRLAFIARLPEADFEQWENGNPPLGRSANATDSGVLVFASHAALTPDATVPLGPEQLYRYEAATGKLNRVSIGERGFNDDGNEVASYPGRTGARIAPGVGGLPGRSPSVSADGRRVFFESPAALAPGALDMRKIFTDNQGEHSYAENVYEWEQAGDGSCPVAQSTGCIYLISDGTDLAYYSNGASDTRLIGTDASGENAFFYSADQLAPADTDTQIDIYDARVEGGFPAPAQTSICETSEACHGPGTAAGPQGSASSNSFIGPEEGPIHPYGQSPKRCRKGFALRHGRCVKKSRRHRHHNRRHRHHKRRHRRANANRRAHR